MNLSLSKLPWYAQIGAFVVVCLGAVFGFWKFYVSEVQSDIKLRQTRLTALRTDIDKGLATARRLPEFEDQVTKLEQRLESLRQVLPEEKDVADILRRIQGLATKSNLTIQRFQPGKVVQQKLYAEIPYKLQAEGTYHNLGSFFDQISKFPRIINISDVVLRAKTPPTSSVSIVAELVATTFVLQEARAGAGKGGTGAVPKQPSLGK
jgi:type IV pilus assembly protein PilO